MNLTSHVTHIYKNLDKTIDLFRAATGMHCPKGCAVCCRDWYVEATVLEVLPVAMEIYHRHVAETIFSSIQELETQQNNKCVLFISNPLLREESACGYYPWRPLLCRLFGFAGRRNKLGRLELSPCKVIRNQYPSEVQRAEMALSAGIKVPIYQEAFMRIASLHPDMGYRRLPINQALKEALEYLYWIKPKGWDWKKAVGW